MTRGARKNLLLRIFSVSEILRQEPRSSNLKSSEAKTKKTYHVTLRLLNLKFLSFLLIVSLRAKKIIYHLKSRKYVLSRLKRKCAKLREEAFWEKDRFQH